MYILVGKLDSCCVILMYIFRSGNYFQLSQFEASIRLFLEDVFLIRPRFKEFLIGYPALLFGFWFADQRFKDMLWFLNSLLTPWFTEIIVVPGANKKLAPN